MTQEARKVVKVKNKLKELVSVFSIYKPQGIYIALWAAVRIFILPYKKLNTLVPLSGTIVDIGCGNGALTNYLALNPKRNLKGIDLSKGRITSAQKTVGKRESIQFIHGDAITTKLPAVDCYLMVDVLHHMPFSNQEKLISFIAKSLKKNSVLIIKEVDPADKIPFLFGHLIEKLLYPKERIYARSYKEWKKLFNSLGLSCTLESGVFYFPDSTKIFVLSS